MRQNRNCKKYVFNPLEHHYFRGSVPNNPNKTLENLIKTSGDSALCTADNTMAVYGVYGKDALYYKPIPKTTHYFHKNYKNYK